jgi:hypothetical protein
MRADTGGNQGLLGGILSQGTKIVNNFASKLGFPVLQIPTRVSDDNRLERAIRGVGNDSIPEALAKIKQSGEGNILGKFLKQTAQGTPDQVGRRAIGGALNIAKNAAKTLLFGNGQPGENPIANNTLSLSGESIRYGSDYRKKYSYQIRRSGDSELGLYTILDNIQNEDPSIEEFVLFKQVQDTTQKANSQNTDEFPSFPKFSVDSITQNIPGKRDKTNTYLDKDNPIYNFRIDKSEIGKFNTTSDKVNLYGVWEGDVEGNPTEQIVDNKTIDDLDFIPLRFYSVAKKQGVSFKATVSGITETFSPSWESSNFIGNPYSFYTYQSINRKIDFSFSVYSLSGEEHKKNWEKLDFFSSLVYPQNTTNDVYVTPPLLKLTLGNMYKNKLGFFESLSYTIDDNTPWEIGLGATKTGNRITNIDPLSDLKDYKLPTIINVTVSYQIIETSNDVVGKKLYPYGA